MAKRTSKITIHFGRKGSGKTWKGCRLVEATKRKVAIWDHNWEWAKQIDKPCTVVRDLRKFALETKKKQARLDRILVFQLPPAQFDLFARWAMATGDQLLVIDEAPLYLKHAKLTPARERLITTSRHRRIDLLLCAHRPSQLSPDVRGQADVVRCWQFVEDLDLKTLAANYGKAFADKLPKLRKHECATWSP